MAEMNRDLP